MLPPVVLPGDQTILGVMVTFSIKIYARMLCLPGLLLPVPLTLLKATIDPRLCWRLPYCTAVWLHCSFLLILVHTRFCLAFQVFIFSSPGKFYNQIPFTLKFRFSGIPSPSVESRGWEVVLGSITFYSSVRTSLV